MKTFNATPIREITVSPRRLLALSAAGEILRSEFVPPHFGGRGFGTFSVELARPIHVVLRKKSK
jgi:hypothetical protein